jgi:hypothetical protein
MNFSLILAKIHNQVKSCLKKMGLLTLDYLEPAIWSSDKELITSPNFCLQRVEKSREINRSILNWLDILNKVTFTGIAAPMLRTFSINQKGVLSGMTQIEAAHELLQEIRGMLAIFYNAEKE